MSARTVLDPASGSRMFYFDREDPRVLFGDIRSESHVLCDGRALEVSPDEVMDFRAIPHNDAQFSVVIFDPPHLIRVGVKSWMFKKYGGLNVTTWREDLAAGLAECFRVLAPNGVLIFKWNATQIPVSEILALTPHKPLIGHRRVRQVGGHALAHVPQGRCRMTRPVSTTGPHLAGNPRTAVDPAELAAWNAGVAKARVEYRAHPFERNPEASRCECGRRKTTGARMCRECRYG